MNTPPILQAVHDYYRDAPVDPKSVQFADSTCDVVSASLLAQLSPVWKCFLGHTPAVTMELGVTQRQFEIIKDVWLRLLTADQHQPDLKRMSAAWSILLLVALDMCQIHPTVVKYVTDHVKTALTLEDCATLAADRSIKALPDCALELILPTLLERPQSVKILNLYLRKAVRKARMHLDPRSVVWINRQKSVDAMATCHMVLNEQREPMLQMGKSARREWRTRNSIIVSQAAALDDVHVVCQIYFNTDGVGEQAKYLLCLNTDTGEMVGRPQRLNHGSEQAHSPSAEMVVNGRDLIIPNYSEIHVFQRSLALFHAEEPILPRQILAIGYGVRVWDMCRGTSDMLFAEDYPYGKDGDHPTVQTLTVMQCQGPEDHYAPIYTIPITDRPGFHLFGGLLLSPTRLVLHFDMNERERGQHPRIKLQIFERDTPVGPPSDMGWSIEQNDYTNRLCHRYGELYYFYDRYDVGFEHGLHIFDAKTDDLSRPNAFIRLSEKASLTAYGARMLVLPTVASYECARALLFDPRTKTFLHGALTIPNTSIKRTVALKGGNIVFVTHLGQFNIVRRVE